MHEHLIIDSPLIAAAFPDIHLHEVDAAVREVEYCRSAGASLLVDAMPVSAGRDVVRLEQIARSTGVAIVATTGLHHDRYYGPRHWSNRLPEQDLAALFIDDLTVGVDAFDYTGPIVRRTSSRAGLVKVATSGVEPDERDRRNIAAAARASVATGAPVLTHCEGGRGGLAQVRLLTDAGVPANAIVLSHVDKSDDLDYLTALAATGAVLELDQTIRRADAGGESIAVRAAVHLVEAGFGSQVVVGTDGARRTLWATLGGSPGLAWLAASFPALLRDADLSDSAVDAIMRTNSLAALRWRAPAAS